MNPFISLAAPIDREEEMDALDLPDARYARVLRGLARVNAVTLARRPTLRFFARILRARPEGAPIRLLDVGFGHGDMLRAIARLRDGIVSRLYSRREFIERRSVGSGGEP